jgi:hypothetical protein
LSVNILVVRPPTTVLSVNILVPVLQLLYCLLLF